VKGDRSRGVVNKKHPIKLFGKFSDPHETLLSQLRRIGDRRGEDDTVNMDLLGLKPFDTSCGLRTRNNQQQSDYSDWVPFRSSEATSSEM